MNLAFAAKKLKISFPITSISKSIIHRGKISYTYRILFKIWIIKHMFGRLSLCTIPLDDRFPVPTYYICTTPFGCILNTLMLSMVIYLYLTCLPWQESLDRKMKIKYYVYFPEKSHEDRKSKSYRKEKGCPCK